jgi:hypothetical protein
MVVELDDLDYGAMLFFQLSTSAKLDSSMMGVVLSL